MMRIIQNMGWVIWGLILLVSSPVLEGKIYSNRYTYVLKIRTPSETEGLHGWRILYKGDMLVPHGNLTKLTEKQCVFSFSIVVTPEVHCTRKTALSSLRHIELEPHEPVRYFDLSLTFSNGSCSWDIVELAAAQIPRILPHHAIIFLYDPALVVSLEAPYKTVYSLETAYEGGHCNFEMPTIVLRGSQAELEHALIHSQHALTKVWSLHRSSPCIMQVIDGIHCAVNVT